MRVNKIATLAPLVLALLVAPGVSLAAVRNVCAASAPTAKSYTWDFQQEAVDLMSSISVNSEDVAAEVDELVINQPFASEDWQFQADKLNQIREDINAMGRTLCRLQAIRSTVPGYEQTGIDKAARKLHLMGARTAEAISYLNTTHTGLWAADFQGYETSLQKEAHQLHDLMHHYVEYAKLQRRQRRLSGTLGAPASS